MRDGRLAELGPLAYFIVINLFAFLAYVWDKSLAQRGKHRVSEANLLLFALLGGWFGALSACYGVRHKVRKSSFMVPLWAIAILESAVLIYSLIFGPPAFIVELLGQAA